MTEETVEPKKSKRANKLWYVGLALSAVFVVFMAGRDLGLFGVNVGGYVGTVNPQSMELASGICDGSFAAANNLKLESIQVLVGIHDQGDGFTTDTVICKYEQEQSVPYMIIYEDGEFYDYQ
jgi:hypothetical protein